MSETLTDRLRRRAFRLATRDFNGDGAKLAVEAADRIAELEAALREARHERDGETRRADVAEEALRRIEAGGDGA